MTFDRIYRENVWNGIESRSGPGSGSAATRLLAPALVDLCAAMRATSVLDVGCGDGFWTPDLPGYIGVDVSAEAVEAHRRRHPSRDIRLDDGEAYPTTDVVLLRMVMQHLSLADGLVLLGRIFTSGPRVLVATTYTDGENVDILTGMDGDYLTAYRVDLRAAPFLLPRPFAVIADGYDYRVPGQVRDPGCVLGLWRVS